MKAIEFVAKTKGGVIAIPKNYLKQISPECRVIILMEPKPKKAAQPKKKKGGLTAISIPTKGFKFNREEANER